MGRYNYYDDDFENEQRENRLSDAFDLLLVKLKGVKHKFSRSGGFSFDDIIHGETITALRTMPNFAALLLKFLAFILFLVFIVVFIAGFAHTINSQNKRNSKFYADSAKVCSDCIADYGSTKWDYLNEEVYGKDSTYLVGLCYVRQMDFDHDGSDELMICYNNGSEYILEVWGYVSGEFSNIYSEIANHTEDETDGYWVSFYHKNNKYYICKSDPETPEKVVLYALRGSAFKKSSECDYDYKDNIYTVKGKIEAYDFETIKLSTIKSAKADEIVEQVSNTLQLFSGSSSLTNESKSDYQLMIDAYYDVVMQRIKKYGKAEIKRDGSVDYINGVSYVTMTDFNNDGVDELVVVYRKMIKSSSIDYRTGNSIVIENPTYCVEVYGWNGTIAKKLLSRDSISGYLEDSDVYYLMLQKSSERVYLCISNYSYTGSNTYTASAIVYGLDDDGFYQSFNARMEYDYGWKSYYIDNEYSGENNFYDEIKRVPLFLDDYGDYDSQEFEVIYMSGKDGVDYDAQINETVKNIQKLNKNYNPDMKID